MSAHFLKIACSNKITGCVNMYIFERFIYGKLQYNKIIKLNFFSLSISVDLEMFFPKY